MDTYIETPTSTTDFNSHLESREKIQRITALIWCGLGLLFVVAGLFLISPLIVGRWGEFRMTHRHLENQCNDTISSNNGGFSSIRKHLTPLARKIDCANLSISQAKNIDSSSAKSKPIDSSNSEYINQSSSSSKAKNTSSTNKKSKNSNSSSKETKSSKLSSSGMNKFSSEEEYVINWGDIVYTIVKGLLIITLLITATNYCFKLAKTFINESFNTANRKDSIFLIKLYTDLLKKNGNLRASDLTEFVNNINKTSFNESTLDIKQLNKAFELICRAKDLPSSEKK